jgi:hypothetical protein
MVDLLMDIMTNPDSELSEKNLVSWLKEDGLRINILNDISIERNRQEQLKKDGKFLWTCADLRVAGYADKLAVLSEEVGEAAKEVVDLTIEQLKYDKEMLEYPKHRREQRRDRLRKELIQVAAVCVAWCEAIDKE